MGLYLLSALMVLPRVRFYDWGGAGLGVCIFPQPCPGSTRQGRGHCALLLAVRCHVPSPMPQCYCLRLLPPFLRYGDNARGSLEFILTSASFLFSLLLLWPIL
ncbi:hypothetical protein ACSBR1_025134 [Camellia fascicularis]